MADLAIVITFQTRLVKQEQINFAHLLKLIDGKRLQCEMLRIFQSCLIEFFYAIKKISTSFLLYFLLGI